MKNKDKKTVEREIATAAYKEVMAIIENHTKRDGEDTVPYFAPDCLEAVCDEIEAMFEENFGVKTVSPKNIDALSWAEIDAIAKSGNAERYFNVGDVKNITLYTGERVGVVILGFNHDVLSVDGSASDTAAGITFGLKDVLDGEYEMNEDFGNCGGWVKSKMRNVYMPRFLKLLPADLQEVVKPVVKLTGAGGGSDDVVSTDDKLFLLSQVEVIGDSTYTADSEGEQYEYFKQDENNTIKRRGGSAVGWWLRSPYTTNSTYFRNIFTTGGVNGSSASSTRGVSFGFCI